MLDTNIGQGYLVRLRLPFDRLGRGSADRLTNQEASLSACRTTSHCRLGPIHLSKMMIPVRYHVWSDCGGENHRHYGNIRSTILFMAEIQRERELLF